MKCLDPKSLGLCWWLYFIFVALTNPSRRRRICLRSSHSWLYLLRAFCGKTVKYRVLDSLPVAIGSYSFDLSSTCVNKLGRKGSVQPVIAAKRWSICWLYRPWLFCLMETENSFISEQTWTFVTAEELSRISLFPTKERRVTGQSSTWSRKGKRPCYTRCCDTVNSFINIVLLQIIAPQSAQNT